MFLGHFAVSFASKKPAPTVSLGTLFIAAQFIDLLWPIFLLLGIEGARIDPGNTAFTPLDFYHYPYTHSLAAVLGWAVAFGGTYYMLKRDLRAAGVLAVAVLSHWVLDFITHRADLPLLPGSDLKLGLGLWNSVAASMLVEGLLFVGAIAVYARTTRAHNKRGSFRLWSLIAFLGMIYVANIVGPPPPDEKALAFVGLLQWLFVPWMYWVDSNRVAAQT
ncbi:MAG TPA: metal-dependent hydrolase [Bacteroidota bacterium]|nr:metal-dependent hydrolase [Bacteroidota bacterium]